MSYQRTTGVWSYAILLIVLFAIATLAVWQTLLFLHGHLRSDADYNVVALLLWSLTLGFMLIAGAFGLWAIRFSSIAESRRSIGHMVDAMDYLCDGLLAVDRKRRITASNPTLRHMLHATLADKERLQDVFPCLDEADRTLLLDTREPSEVQRQMTISESTRTLRFRSQPSHGLMLIQISDVTSVIQQQKRRRQVARLQLVGQIARGIANDFNNLLYGISGYASLLSRMEPRNPEMDQHIKSIIQSADKGITLAAHLTELSQTGTSGKATNLVEQHVATAAEILRDTLSADWRVDFDVDDDFPPVALGGLQIEQIVLNLGLLAADAHAEPALLRVIARTSATAGAIYAVDNAFAGTIVVSVPTSDTALLSPDIVQDEDHDTGVIQSIIRSLLEGSGGALDRFSGPRGFPIYRIRLPHGRLARPKGTQETLPGELTAYLASWRILLATPQREYTELEKRLDTIGCHYEQTDHITGALARVEKKDLLDGMILHEPLLGHESKGVLKAILKLKPTTAIAVLCENPEASSADLQNDITFVSVRAGADQILSALIDARTLASRRVTAT